MSLMPNRCKYGVNRSFRGPVYFSRCHTRQFIEFIMRLLRLSAPTGSIVKLQRELVAYCLCLRGLSCDCCITWRWGQTKKKKPVSLKRPVKNAICERYLCILWFTALLYLNGVWLYGRRIWPEVGRLYSLDVLQGMSPMETKVMGEVIDIGPNPLHPPITSVSTWM